MVSKVMILTAAFAVTSISATQVTNFILDIAGGLGSGSCSSVVSFDDAPDVELEGCASTSDGITVPTELGDVTVKCDVNGGGVNGENQCGSQRVVCRSGCCVTIDLQSADSACSIPDFCTGGDCEECDEKTGSNVPASLTC